MSVNCISNKLNNLHINEPYHENINIESNNTTVSNSLYNTLCICVNIKDTYNLNSSVSSIIYTDKSNNSYFPEPCISPNPITYICPSPPRANKNKSFCWSYALK